MKPTSIIQRLVILLVTLMSAIGANADEAYACYTSSNTTLTFYYDNQRSSRTGKTYDLNTGDENPGWDTDGTKAYVTKVVFHWSFGATSPTTTYSWFYAMRQLQSIEGLGYLKTSMVTNMAWMFGYCSSLTSLDLSSFNTAKVTDMDYMFNGCTSLQTIYAGSGWITNTVSSSTAMFSDCTSLVGGKRTNYDKNHVDKTYAHIDGGSNNPGYFTALGTLAYACYTESNTTLTFYYDDQRNSRSGTTYNLNTGATDTRWDTDGTKSYVTKVVFDPSFAGARPTSTYGWFYDMRNLQSIEGLGYLNTIYVTNMAYMFMYCDKLTNLDLSQFYTAKVTDMDYMFYGCTNLQTIYVTTRWRTSAVTSSERMFEYCESLEGGKGTTYNENHVDADYAHIDGVTNSPGYLTGKNEMYACYTRDNSTLTFYYDFYRSDHDDQGHKTYGGLEIRFIDKPGWSDMGAGRVVFDPSFAEARPTSTKRWFEGMSTLKSIDGMKYLNTSEVTDMAAMFKKCYHLIIIDVSNFDTSNVTNMHSMFKDCYDVVSLDLSSFNTAKLSMAPEMFQMCRGLQTIYVGSGWTTTALTYSVDMFTDCTTKLKGGKGTTWNSSNPTDKTYARIDGGPSNPGYFTYKGSSSVATGIENGQRDAVKVQSSKFKVQSEEWYTLDGQKLSGKPTKRGVYIQNGKKAVLNN